MPGIYGNDAFYAQRAMRLMRAKLHIENTRYHELLDRGLDPSEAEDAVDAEIEEGRISTICCTCSEDRWEYPDQWEHTTDIKHEDGCEAGQFYLDRVREAERQLLYVNVYLVDRAYGGPEEGGWYFDTGELLAVYPVPNAVDYQGNDVPGTAINLARMLQGALEKTKYSNEGRYPVHSVLSAGEYQVSIDFAPGESYPKRRPHYE